MSLKFTRTEGACLSSHTPVKKIRDHPACHSSRRVIKEWSGRVKSDKKWW